MSNTIKQADKNTIEIMLMITESCNLSCRYCYEVNKSKKKMSFDIAKKIIDKEIKSIEKPNENIVI